MSLTKYRKFLQICILYQFFSHSGTPVAQMLLFDMLPHIPKNLFPFFPPVFFPVFFRLDNFCRSVFRFTDSLSVIFILLLSPSSEVFFSPQTVFSFLKFSFDSFHTLYFSVEDFCFQSFQECSHSGMFVEYSYNS